MKAKRRHDLKQNVLNAELAKGVQFLRKRGTQIAWGVLIVAVVIFGIVYYRSRTRSATENVQTRFQNALWLAENPQRARDSAQASEESLIKEFRELSEQTDVERVAALATVEVADRYAAQAFAAAGLKDAETEQEDLEADATRYYRKAVEKFPGEALAVARARLGLAKLAEGNQQMDAARTEYQAVLAMKGKVPAPLIEMARDCIDQLDTLDLRPMATTAPSKPTTAPATQPATRPAAQPTSGPSTAPAPRKAGPTTRPAPKPAPKPKEPASKPAPRPPRT